KSSVADCQYWVTSTFSRRPKLGLEGGWADMGAISLTIHPPLPSNYIKEETGLIFNSLTGIESLRLAKSTAILNLGSDLKVQYPLPIPGAAGSQLLCSGLGGIFEDASLSAQRVVSGSR
ncbi:hypothetical protein, partial [Acaryochloris sp. IP29b_bin.137]|uniref:hypothetical protein n=1 Tax=Acaryochloris sp. IP29b_bin.137 TaxID=2969217 RepID=UPI00260C47CB